MRGRKPKPLKLNKKDVPELEHLARRRVLPFYQVERARALLALARGERIEVLAARMECDPATVWRLARRYEACGLACITSDAPREGHPLVISPLSPRPDRRTRHP